jgi:GNAT superfamily N-acetyltransferase
MARTREITYRTGVPLSVEQFIDVLERSTLGERRPIRNAEVMRRMVEEADVWETAWDGDVPVGVARSLTDYAYCCYLSDLAVDAAYQRRGIGKRLIDVTRSALGPSCKLILLAAPAAMSYYPHIGFVQHPSAWTLDPDPGMPRAHDRAREPGSG